MKLNELSKEQIAKMSEVKQYWLNYIFSCKSCIDREKAKKGIDWLYRFSGAEEPIVIFVESPMACQLAVAYLKEFVKKFPQIIGRDSVWDSVGASVWDSVRDSVGASVRDSVWDSVGASVGASVWASVGASVGDSVWDSVGASVGDSVWASVGASVWASVGDSVWDSVGASVRDSVGASVRDSVWDSVGASVRASVGASVWASVGDSVWASVGASVWASVRDSGLEYQYTAQYGSIADYGWVSFYDFFTQIGVINHEAFSKFKDLIGSGIYDTIQLNGFCIVSNMPTKIIRNASGRLHNPTGPAIEFADGYKQFYINGRALPEWIWQKAAAGEITRDMFMKEENSEIKGGIYEVLGQKKMMDLLGAVEIDKRDIVHANGDTEIVTLLKTKQKFKEIDNQPFAWVKMVCPSTGSQYLQGVEPHHKDALAAIASLSPFKPEEYSFHMRS